MVVTLTGENSFTLTEALRRLTGPFASEHGGLALERLDGEETEFARMREAVTSLPFLVSKKMVVLRAPSKNKQFSEAFEQLLDEIPKTTEVVLVEPKLDKRLSYYKALKKKTDFQEFPELDQAGLARWLSEGAKAQGGSLSTSDARYLIERVGANQQLLSNELNKLLLYDNRITRQAIGLLTDESPQSTIFQLLEAGFAGNKKRTLELYAEQRALKVEPPQIIAMLAWQLHVLAIIKTAGNKSVDEIAREAKLNPFVVRKSQALTRNQTLQELRSKVQALLNIDVKSKSTNLDADEALQNYLLSLSD